MRFEREVRAFITIAGSRRITAERVFSFRLRCDFTLRGFQRSSALEGCGRRSLIIRARLLMEKGYGLFRIWV